MDASYQWNLKRKADSEAKKANEHKRGLPAKTPVIYDLELILESTKLAKNVNLKPPYELSSKKIDYNTTKEPRKINIILLKWFLNKYNNLRLFMPKCYTKSQNTNIFRTIEWKNLKFQQQKYIFCIP